MPEIAHIANLWTLRGHPPGETEWTLDKTIAAVAAAGFDGITTNLKPEHRRLAERVGLHHLVGFISSSDPNEFERKIREQKEAGAIQINVQLDDDDTPPKIAAHHWLQMMQLAEKIGGVVLSLEVHRDTCTETPEKTYEIADHYQKAAGELIRFNFDFSHLAVVKHLAPEDYSQRLLIRPDLVGLSEQCHFRPFNGHHCQVPVTFKDQLSVEVQSYLVFAADLMKLWASASSNRSKTWFVCPEMGPYQPNGYNISGLPPAWPDAIVLRSELAKLWTTTLQTIEPSP